MNTRAKSQAVIYSSLETIVTDVRMSDNNVQAIRFPEFVGSGFFGVDLWSGPKPILFPKTYTLNFFIDLIEKILK